MIKKPLPVNVKEIPHDLKAIPHWVNWKQLKSDKKTKPIKMPLNPNRALLSKNAASVSDPNTWSTYDQAVKNINKKEVAGIGFVLTKEDPYVVIDIDHCINAKGGIDPMALYWAEELGSYTEVSPSGTGIHIFVKHDESVSDINIAGGKKTKVKDSASGLGFEIYRQNRYFTMTGQPVICEWDDCGEIEDVFNILDLFYMTYFHTSKSRKSNSKTWRPEDGVIGEGDRNNVMAQVVGSVARNVFDLIAVDDETFNGEEKGLHDMAHTIVEHYNQEYFKPPLTTQEMTAHTRSMDKYLDDFIATDEDYLTDDDMYERDQDEKKATSWERETEGYDDNDDDDGNKKHPPIPKDVAHKLVKRFVFIAGQNKFYDREAHQLLTKDAVNQTQGDVILKSRHSTNAQRTVPLTQFMKYSKSKDVIADVISWQPDKPAFVNDWGEEYKGKGCKTFNTYIPVDYSQCTRALAKSDLSLYHQLLDHVIPDKTLQNAYLDYLAFTLQHPAKKINYGILLVSEYEGVGKDLLLRPVVDIMQKQCSQITADMLASQFNDYLKETKLLIIGEIHQTVFGRGQSMEDYLKYLLASPPTKLQINAKNIKVCEVDNVVSVIMTSNHANAIAIKDAAKTRRYLAIRCPLEPLDKSFYKKYADWLSNNKGTYSIVRFLLDRDVTNFEVGRAPYLTDLLKDLEVNSRGDVHIRVSHLLTKNSSCFNRAVFDIQDVVDELDDDRVSYLKVLSAVKKLGFHYFGTGANGVSYKLVRLEGGGRARCNLFCKLDSSKFDMFCRMSGKKLMDLHAHEPALTLKDLSSMSNAKLSKLVGLDLENLYDLGEETEKLKVLRKQEEQEEETYQIKKSKFAAIKERNKAALKKLADKSKKPKK